jgi:hypothetical protein
MIFIAKFLILFLSCIIFVKQFRNFIDFTLFHVEFCSENFGNIERKTLNSFRKYIQDIRGNETIERDSRFLEQ